MRSCLDPGAIMALLEGRMSTNDRRKALGHIAICASCRGAATQRSAELPSTPGRDGKDLDVSEQPANASITAVASGEDLTAAAKAASEKRSPDDGTSTADESMIGRVIDGYRLDCELGRGGMGTVYRGVHERIGQRAAVKVLFPQLSKDPSYVRRFLSEARAASVVQHPGLVTIFNYGQLEGGTAYILMEYLEGASLRRRMDARKLDVAESLHFVRLIASALSAVHMSGIVHRDLKPENVMIVSDVDMPLGERTKVVDFGIAKLGVAQLGLLSATGSLGDQRAFVGSVDYASPEQCSSSPLIDGKSDVYSLGVMLYELLGGAVPFSGPITEVLKKHRDTAPRSLRSLNRNLPPALLSLVEETMAKQQEARPLMTAVRDRIDQILITLNTKK